MAVLSSAGRVRLATSPSCGCGNRWIACRCERAVAAATSRHRSPSAAESDEFGELGDSFKHMVRNSVSPSALLEPASSTYCENGCLLRADAKLFQSLSLDSVLQALVDVTVDVLGAVQEHRCATRRRRPDVVRTAGGLHA